MAIPKILLYYIFTPLADPEAVRLWQRDLCAGLGLRGRILISKDGVNGTVGGDLPAIKKYIRKTRDYPAFKNIDFKWSEGTGLDESGQSLDFPKLVVKVRDEIVSFGAPGELQVDATGVVGGGTKLQPAELNALVAARGDEVVFFDGRNKFEAEIGHFSGAVVPDVANTREFVAELDSGKYDHLKGKPVVTYCTGGIRCEVLSGLMKSRGFGEVYQLDGGIVRYGEAFGNAGLWSGSLYVFDQRMSIDFAPDAAVLGTCRQCATPTTNMLNCREASCREQLVVCAACVALAPPACVTHTGVPVT
ncbi:rhodanese-related sulfurtransferase [Cryobacterium sp. PH29-G1]|uniref:oxygen-dependent tRNA uridine(34) hydroxylase TrhO n=1 Tax=Cryobacterium sp. PH29-G1 TaxID=3046211 RepID=UPI0024B9C3E0|nr:rhodanese-related sulfurtransferase [Cryobacterium sp. PH29-G1]MDJ0348803.1 rhodanese-related sulfurtransferase [Cryobacterium sp. PH29-G1]